MNCAFSRSVRTSTAVRSLPLTVQGRGQMGMRSPFVAGGGKARGMGDYLRPARKKILYAVVSFGPRDCCRDTARVWLRADKWSSNSPRITAFWPHASANARYPRLC